ncbi:MAG: lipoyl(octanoyl) transferase LipB [Alphaproteobacteria bacterium]|nr:lipoyl(octanoyl) transferase LipB [Alphaproteobacteria bacterium]MDA8004521.1 lipoyl(octanoyl) transferase LipB [Alphaproteobacteria bacterium]MDA8006519.1 lipoyl(octanoyl) transferase LipB [Alphaproteobacteria bacterium]MDA8012384.1 lipoyl(octanoyl) transferase LipB [Alphaproteobacteria bacterium]
MESKLTRGGGVEVRRSSEPVGYDFAVAVMEERVAALVDGRGAELLWLLEHPALYTAGSSARDEELLATDLPVYRSGRGGRYTYHGPGQRVGYVVMDLRRRGGDVRLFVRGLEDWVRGALLRLGVESFTREGRIGLWVEGAGGIEEKVAALGIRVRRGVAFHGVSVNVDPDLGHFGGIVPCGLRGYGVTSLARLGAVCEMADVDAALEASFFEIFGTN